MREDRFGYMHLPDGMPLKDAVDLELWQPDEPIVGINHKRWWNYETGETE